MKTHNKKKWEAPLLLQLEGENTKGGFTHYTGREGQHSYSCFWMS